VKAEVLVECSSAANKPGEQGAARQTVIPIGYGTGHPIDHLILTPLAKARDKTPGSVPEQYSRR